MNEFSAIIFQWANFLNSHGLNNGGLLHAFLVPMTIFFFYNVYFSVDYSLRDRICFGSLLLMLIYIGLEIKSPWDKTNSANYPVGRCFQERGDREELKSQLKYDQAQVAKVYAALRKTPKTNSKNTDLLSYSLREQENNVAETQQRLVQAFPRFVVISQEEDSHLVFNQSANKIETDFSIGYSRYQVECSEDLKKIAKVYQETGKLVANNK